VDLITGFADRLWKDLVGSSSKQDGSLPYSVTTIALGFSGVEPGEAGQQSIEGFFRPGTSTMLQSSPDRDGNDPRRTHREKRQRETEDGEGSSDDILEIEEENRAFFVCPRCHKRIAVELGDDGEGEPEQRRAKALMEHSDFHVAEDLSKRPDDGINGGSRRLRAEKKKRKSESSARKDRDQPAEGIAKYLVRRRDE
jgi:DNA polymerase eta